MVAAFERIFKGINVASTLGMKARLPENEAMRLQSLQEYDILDTLSEQSYNDVTLLASIVCQTPIALISFVDRDRQWFKAHLGLDVAQTSRDFSFCAHAILQPEQILTVPDARSDARFRDNPLVTGHPHIQFYSGAPLVAPNGQPLGTICALDYAPNKLTWRQEEALRALSRQVVTLLEFRRQSHTDELTKLKNRRAFDERLQKEIESAARHFQPLSLLMLDVDRFKAVNDEFGHSTGDVLLQDVAQTLHETARASDFVARHGGEEFAVLLPETDTEGALTMAERFRQSIEQMFSHARPISVSVGVATLHFGANNFHNNENDLGTALFHAADKALYKAKQNGRNRVETEAS